MIDLEEHLPFLMINSVLENSYRKRLIKRVIDYYRNSSVIAKKKLNKVLQNLPIKIDGFRRIDMNAPKIKLYKPLEIAFCACNPLVESILCIWMESHNVLEKLVEGFLVDKQIKSVKFSDLGGKFILFWELEKVMTYVKEFLVKHPDFDENDVGLMLCCLVGCLPIPGEVIEKNKKEKQLMDDRKKVCETVPKFSGLLGEMFDKLSSLPYEASEWLELLDFIENIKELKEKKYKEYESQHNKNKLKDLVNQIAENLSKELSFCKINIQDLAIHNLSTENLEFLTKQFLSFKELLEKLSNLLQTLPNNIDEHQKWNESLVEIVSSINNIYSYICSLVLIVPPQNKNFEAKEHFSEQNKTKDVSEKKKNIDNSDMFISLNYCDSHVKEDNIQDIDIITINEFVKTENNILEKNVGIFTKNDSNDIEKLQLSTIEIEEKQEDNVNQNISSTLANPIDTVNTYYGKENIDKSQFILQDDIQVIEAKEKNKKLLNLNGKEIIGKLEENFLNTSFSISTSKDVAKLILNDARENVTSRLEELIWNLLAENKLSLAFHLNRCCELMFPSNKRVVPSWLIRAIILSQNIRHDVGELSNLLKKDFSNFVPEIFSYDGEWNQVLSFLLASASLRPALLAPSTNASRILHLLYYAKDGLGMFKDYCEIIAEYGDNSQPIDLSLLKGKESWEKKLQELWADIDSWWEKAPKFKMSFVPITHIWQHWIKKGQLIENLITTIRNDKVEELGKVCEKVNFLSDEKAVLKEVQRLEKNNLSYPSKQGIEVKILSSLLKHTNEVVELCGRWISICKSRPNENSDWITRKTNEVHKNIKKNYDFVVNELETFVKKNSSFSEISVSEKICLQAIKDIKAIFSPVVEIKDKEPLQKHLLNADFLKMSFLPLSDNLEPRNYDPKIVMEQILNFISNEDISWHQAFEERAELRDHSVTLQIIEYVEANRNSTTDSFLDIEDMRKGREKNIRECKDALKRDLQNTRESIESAIVLSLLKEADRDSLITKIQQIENTIDEILEFKEKHNQLTSIKQSIEEERTNKITNVKQRLEKAGIEKGHFAYNRICSVLEKGDILTANEYIDTILQKNFIPEFREEINSFKDFFPQKYREIEDFLEPDYETRPTPQYIIDIVNSRKTIGPIQMRPVAGPQAEQAADMLKSWFTAKKAKKIDEHSLTIILSSLGFNVIKITFGSQKNKPCLWINITTEIIQERERCPVSYYGSNAKGSYRVLCVWERPTEEDLLNEIGDNFQGSPVIVFHFGRMTEKRRKDLARMCRERRRTFVVIDDVLMLYLCGERGSRLPRMFECSLPFTFLKPYTTTASLVPPEIFYGRRIERESIISPMGSCFIYGGRQLGKTALLRDVQRTFHSPTNGRIAIWLDLKTSGIGYNRPVDEIWTLIADEFKVLDIIPNNVPPQTRENKLLEYVQKWLEQDDKRHILLLLDEADRFLVIDGKKHAEGEEIGEFTRAALLKGLMDRTNRRFKVIFAGLHNVQRTTRLENHPLAHYGDPMCIGPLLDNGESREVREARALIEKPFASLGYYFEPRDLVFRILSQTNYYPSLIQLYCDHLLKHVTSSNNFTIEHHKSPPYTITSKHVEDAYRSQDLRRAIRERFKLTLDLDTRYRVIALAIALYSLEDDDRVSDGFSTAWIREQALTFWNQGFQDTSEDAFRVLLDEMVGLGVLKNISVNHYSLRSLNVALLIGIKEEIESELESSSNKELSPDYEAATFRSSLKEDSSRRSPLTAQQESELRSRKNEVSIVFGSEAAGIEDLEQFLIGAFGKEFFFKFGQITDKAQFVKQLSDLGKREKNGTNLVFVPYTCPWADSWVDEAINRLNRLTSKTSFVRILFVADSQTTWQLTNTNTENLDKFREKHVTCFTLKPWHDLALWQWLEDIGFPNLGDKNNRQRITKVTGNWPILLYELYNKTKNAIHLLDHHLSKIEMGLKEKETVKNLEVSFGLRYVEAKKVLHNLAILGEASIENLMELTDLPPEIVYRSIVWADLLNLVFPSSNKTWKVDPIVDKLVKLGTE